MIRRLIILLLIVGCVFGLTINVPSDSTTIQAGINGAESGDTVLVATGIYYENIVWPATHGIKLIGSGEGNCIIDGNAHGRVIQLEGNSFTTISGFTIQNGDAQGDLSGGGMSLYMSSAILTNITFSGNTAYQGGGLYGSYSPNPSLSHVRFSGNTAHLGGGMYLANCNNPTLSDITFSGNTAVNGGGMYLYGLNNPTLTGLTFSDNMADWGGGMYFTTSNCILTNSILWGNSYGKKEIYFNTAYNPNSITITNSNIQGGETGIETNDNGTVYWGDGNIDDDPLFCDSRNGDYTLASNSPCVGTGVTGDNIGVFDVGCEESIVYGCLDELACNYNQYATVIETCEYPDDFGWCDCDGNIEDCSGVCGGSDTPEYGADCDGNCISPDVVPNCNPELYQDSSMACCLVGWIGDGTCDGAYQIYGCDLSCYDCDGGDCLIDGICYLGTAGCQDEAACNYDETATDSGDCTHTDAICESCVDGEIVDNDSDDDTVCDDMDVCDGYDDTLDSDGDGTPDGCDLSIYEGIIPDNFSIASIYPNPFNPVTSITYGLPENTDIQITVYDMGGTHITTLVNTFQIAGYHTISWNASSYPSGVYLIRMESGDFTQTQKVVLVK